MPGQVAYNPDDPLQLSLLSAISSVESPSGPNPWSEGFSNIDLSNNPTTSNGFYEGSTVNGGPVNGNLPTSAEGPFQFEPATWNSIASQYGLNFQNPGDQEAGAWYNAQNTVAAQGGNLETELQQGEYSTIAQQLGGQWQGIQNNPNTFLSNLESGNISSVIATGAGNPSSATGATAANSSGSTGTSSLSLGSLGSITDVEDFFVRFGIIIIGGVIILVALWQLLSQHSSIPGPVDTVKIVGKTVSKGAELAAA